MNAADLARLELAKRAYRAAAPSDAEVQTGVRRARLWLGRPKPRRAWFSKGLVLVVLAIGSLAYAKPQAAGELVDKVLGRAAAPNDKRLKAGVGVEAPVTAVLPAAAARPRAEAVARKLDDRATEAAEVATPVAIPAPGQEAPAPQAVARPGTAVAPRAAASTRAASTSPRLAGATTAEAITPVPARPIDAVTDWGRVGQALAQGDSAEALSALGQLAESDDPSTRDKADLGRAQLLMAQGQSEQACGLARSLTHRRAGGRIERQAQLLLKSCTR